MSRCIVHSEMEKFDKCDRMIKGFLASPERPNYYLGAKNT